MSVALQTVMTNPQVLFLGIVCSLYEASMFIFVFMWTPALTEEGAPKPEYGHIFAAFMVMAMLGSQVFSLESDRRFLSFLAFEMTVGLYFPMMGTLKGMIVPE